MQSVYLRSFLMTAFILGICHCQSSAQGNTRVIKRTQNGLAYPLSTQIGEGTLSQTARGDYGRSAIGLPSAPLGPSVLPGDSSRSDFGQRSKRSLTAATYDLSPQSGGFNLPETQLGPHVNPGDASRTDLSGRSAARSGLPAAPIGPHMRAGDIDRSDLHPNAFRSNERFWHPERQIHQSEDSSSKRSLQPTPQVWAPYNQTGKIRF